MTETFPCAWAPLTDELYRNYHDTEWGVPERDGRALWEKLQLDGMQAGLAWIDQRARDDDGLLYGCFFPVRLCYSNYVFICVLGVRWQRSSCSKCSAGKYRRRQ